MSEEKVPMIYSAICGVMEDIGVVGKGDYNRLQGFKYRGIDSVMNALNPAMIKHKIFCTPEVLEQNREERATKNGGALIYSVCRMRYRFFTIDGSYIDAVVVGEGMDSGDKATNKAMSVAFKYACFQTFCIPTESLMDDPDASIPEKNTKADTAKAPSSEKNTKADVTKAPSSGENTKTNNSNKKDTQSRQDAEKKSLLEELAKELVRTGYGWAAVMKTYKVESVDHLSKLQIKDCLQKMRKQPDKAASR